MLYLLKTALLITLAIVSLHTGSSKPRRGQSFDVGDG